MRPPSILTLALLWLAVMASSEHTVAQAAGHHGCCTAFSKIRVVISILKNGGVVKCRHQGITERCSINAVVLKWKQRKVCVDPTPRKMRNLLAILCNRKAHNGDRQSSRPHRSGTKI